MFFGGHELVLDEDGGRDRLFLQDGQRQEKERFAVTFRE
jgi:hypothetical protein